MGGTTKHTGLSPNERHWVQWALLVFAGLGALAAFGAVVLDNMNLTAEGDDAAAASAAGQTADNESPATTGAVEVTAPDPPSSSCDIGLNAVPNINGLYFEDGVEGLCGYVQTTVTELQNPIQSPTWDLAVSACESAGVPGVEMWIQFTDVLSAEHDVGWLLIEPIDDGLPFWRVPLDPGDATLMLFADREKSAAFNVPLASTQDSVVAVSFDFANADLSAGGDPFLGKCLEHWDGTEGLPGQQESGELSFNLLTS